MKITKYLFLAGISAIVLSSCSKLGKLTDENFTVVPTPLEVIGGEVPATINGTFPVKYMKKKAEVTVTPVLKYNGGEVIGQSATFQGEKVEGNGTTISYKMGGVYTMKANFAYEDAMLNSDLYARFDAKLGNKVVSIPEVKIGYGVVATSQLLSRCGMTASTAPDAFQRIIEQKQEANIKFLINQANLRASELNTVSIKDLGKILREINDNEETRALQNIEVSAYASPDGKLSFNEKLAEKRQDVSANYLKGELKKIQMNADVDTTFTAEDWDGFQELISKSNLQDRDIIIRVLSMYKDPEEREEQIRNMSAVYTDIKESILPELRRARLIVNYEIIGRSDDQIVAQFSEDPSKLSVEELVYGAILCGAQRSDVAINLGLVNGFAVVLLHICPVAHSFAELAFRGTRLVERYIEISLVSFAFCLIAKHVALACEAFGKCERVVVTFSGCTCEGCFGSIGSFAALCTFLVA